MKSAPLAGSIVLTGATGFIGSHLLSSLCAAFPESDIVALGREETPVGLPPRVRGGRIELNRPEEVREIIAALAPSVVIHLAGQASVAEAGASPWLGWQENMFGAVTVAEATRSTSPGATFVFASTAEVYGHSFEDGAPLDETAPLQPTNAYARSKVAAEYALEDIWSGADGCLVCLRLFNHVGAGQSERFVASSFAAQLARMEAGKRERVIRVGNLSVQRDFGNIRDLSAAFTAVLSKRGDLPARAVFNVCSGKTRPVQEVLDILIGYSTIDPVVEQDPRLVRPGEVTRVAGSNAAITAATGWTPRHDLKDALKELLAHWRNAVGREA